MYFRPPGKNNIRKQVKINAMTFKPSTILSFYTGRLYTSMPPTQAFGPLIEAATGNNNVFTHELSGYRKKYAEKIINQCPDNFQKICRNWDHTENWQSEVRDIDNAFGQIVISRC